MAHGAEIRSYQQSGARRNFEAAIGRFPVSRWNWVLGRNLKPLADWRTWLVASIVIASLAAIMGWVGSVVSPQTGYGPCFWQPGCRAINLFFGWDGWVVLWVVLGVAGAILSALAFLAARYMAKSIRQWIRRTQAERLVHDANQVRERVGSIVLNEWVLSGYRIEAVDMLRAARETLHRLAELVSKETISDQPPEERPLEEVHVVNPMIERNLNLEAGSMLFRAFDPVVEVVRLDILDFLLRIVRSHWPRLRGQSRGVLPEEIQAATAVRLHEYKESLDAGTLLSDVGRSTAGTNRRRRVLETLWSDADLVAETVAGTLTTSATDAMLQMVDLGEVPLMEQSPASTVFVRFLPELAQKQAAKIAAESGVAVSALVFSEQITAAGVLRLAPIREGVVELVERSDIS